VWKSILILVGRWQLLEFHAPLSKCKHWPSLVPTRRKWLRLLGPALFQYANEASVGCSESPHRPLNSRMYLVEINVCMAPFFCLVKQTLLECAISNCRTCSRDRFISALLTLAEIINYRVDTLPRSRHQSYPPGQMKTALSYRLFSGADFSYWIIVRQESSVYRSNRPDTFESYRLFSEMMRLNDPPYVKCYLYTNIGRIIGWPPLLALSCYEFDHSDYRRLFLNSNFTYITVLCVRLSINGFAHRRIPFKIFEILLIKLDAFKSILGAIFKTFAFDLNLRASLRTKQENARANCVARVALPVE